MQKITPREISRSLSLSPSALTFSLLSQNRYKDAIVVSNIDKHLVCLLFRLAAAEQAGRARDKAGDDVISFGASMGKRRPGALEPGQTGPTSLFILSETNIIKENHQIPHRVAISKLVKRTNTNKQRFEFSRFFFSRNRFCFKSARFPAFILTNLLLNHSFWVLIDWFHGLIL